MAGQKTIIEISPKSVLLTIGILVALFIAWKIRGVLIALFVAYILMSGFAPLVDWLSARGVNKALSIAFTYLVAITFFAALLFFVIPPLISQTREFVSNIPTHTNNLLETLDINGGLPPISTENLITILTSRLGGALNNILAVVLNVFSLFISFITVAVFTFYLLLERERIKRNLFRLFPALPKEQVYSLAHKIEQKLGAWVRGELVLMLVIGLATYIGLTLLRVEFALPLAVIAGLLELVPTLGPIISSVPAIIIAFVQGPILAIAVTALYILIQQLENNFLVPIVMRRAVGLHPLITILALLIGGTLFGIVGAILAVPASAVTQVIFEDYVETKEA